MATEIATSAISEKVSYATSTTNPEQHSLPRSIALHLLPGILTGAAFFLIAPITQRKLNPLTAPDPRMPPPSCWCMDPL